MRDRDRFRGCLVGGAAGDALGYTVEFMRLDKIISRYGSQGITGYELHNGRALISDDTQMTLFTAAGLLRGTKGKKFNGIASAELDGIREGYMEWLDTQSGCKKDHSGGTWLSREKGLYALRAPGNTCLSALRSGGKGSLKKPVNDSKGCGGVMRVAPIGLYFNDMSCGMAMVDTLGAKAAALTHGHRMGWLPAAALVHIIQCITEGGMSISDAVEESIVILPVLFPEEPMAKDMAESLEKALLYGTVPDSGDDREIIKMLGEGWVGDEALIIAVYCALKYHDDLGRAIITAVNHDGDSDSTGAICGQIVGASIGYEAIPDKWKNDLELLDVILQTADDLWVMPDDRSEDWYERY